MASSVMGRGGRVLLAVAMTFGLGTGATASAATATATSNESVERTAICYVPPGPPGQYGREHTVRVPAGVVADIIRHSRSYRGPCAAYGRPLPLGDGSLRTFTQVTGGKPVTMGVTFPASTLRNLPVPVTDGKHCYDKDGDGRYDPHTECSVGHEHELNLPASFLRRVDTPFKWALTNWNPEGHIPQGVYNVPHFDFHFYLQPLAERNAIRPGPCPVLTHCDDYARAKVPVPAQYMPPDYIDVDAVEPAMGNHLVDPTAPEFNGQPFTHTWIYGTYDGEITFYEAMITKAWFDGQRDGSIADRCVPFKQAGRWQVSGWYPTRYCMEYRENRRDYTVALTDWVYRTAS